jgi:hypothetical protein
MGVITHGGTLPDLSQKTDFYAVVDNSSVTNIVNADISATAAIAGSKLSTLNTITSGAGVIPAANLTSVAQKGANSDITSITGLTTALTTAQGGTGATAAANAANGVVVLNASSQLPAVSGALLTNVALSSYDSGWFSVSPGTAYSKTHNLGTTKLIVKLYWASDSNGTSMTEVFTNDPDKGWGIKNITTTTLAAQTGTLYVTSTYADNGTQTNQNSGYYRVIALALP